MKYFDLGLYFACNSKFILLQRASFSHAGTHIRAKLFVKLNQRWQIESLDENLKIYTVKHNC